MPAALALVAALSMLHPCEAHFTGTPARLERVNLSPELSLSPGRGPLPTDRATRRQRLLFISNWMQAGMIASANGFTLRPDQLREWIDEALGLDARLETFEETRAAETIEYLRANAASVAPPFGTMFLRYNRKPRP